MTTFWVGTPPSSVSHGLVPTAAGSSVRDDSSQAKPRRRLANSLRPLPPLLACYSATGAAAAAASLRSKDRLCSRSTAAKGVIVAPEDAAAAAIGTGGKEDAAVSAAITSEFQRADYWSSTGGELQPRPLGPQDELFPVFCGRNRPAHGPGPAGQGLLAPV